MWRREVRTRADVVRLNGKTVAVHGSYLAIPVPIRGGADIPRPADRAVIVLADGTRVYLEPLDSDASTRAPSEIERLDGRAVRARGTIHEVMPARGESLIAPCLAGVHDLEPAE